MNQTSIEWTDYTANPLKYRTADGRVVWACEKLSPGCAHCYAEHLSTRYGGVRRAGEWNAATMAGLTPFLDEAEIRRMLTYKPAAGRRVFVGDMTDVFGEWVPDALLDRLFAVFALRDGTRSSGGFVTFQVLTKRAERMRRYLSDPDTPFRIAAQVCKFVVGFTPLRGGVDWTSVTPWPSPNVWIGVSAENQATANARIPALLKTPAAVRFVSAEPLLGDINIAKYLDSTTEVPCCGQDGCEYCDGTGTAQRSDLNWVIVGGESGPGARPCHAGWIESVIEQCVSAGTACFVKQAGSFVLDRNDAGFEGDSVGGWPMATEYETQTAQNWQGDPVRVRLKDMKGGDPAEWPRYLRVREFPEMGR